jgi:phosphoribosylanthranilate isomerase
LKLAKICGFREFSHMQAAASEGADLLGMVFVPEVRRTVNPKAASKMVAELRKDLGRETQFVGLFADQPVKQVIQICAEVGLDWVQLCGNEDTAYRALMPCPVIQVLHVPGLPKTTGLERQAMLTSLTYQLVALEEQGYLAILDGIGPGGSGETIDWSLAAELADQGRHFLLAGGLTPTNVAEAITTVDPVGVDVSSGVETGGVKDIEKIRDFIHAARRAQGEIRAYDRKTS